MTSPAGIRSYLKAISAAEAETLKDYPEHVKYIDDLDKLFRRLVTGKARAMHPICGFLAMNAHASFLAAATSACQGQSPPTFMLMRGCIENALYSFLVSLDKADGDIWMRRASDLTAFKTKFSANRAIQKLQPIDPNLATMARDAYQWAIEFGAHPNPRGLIDHIRPKTANSKGDVPFSLIYVQGAGSVAHIRALGACIETGCMAVAVICHALPKHPKKPQTFNKVWKLFQSYQKFIEDEGYYSPSKENLA